MGNFDISICLLLPILKKPDLQRERRRGWDTQMLHSIGIGRIWFLQNGKKHCIISRTTYWPKEENVRGFFQRKLYFVKKK